VGKWCSCERKLGRLNSKVDSSGTGLGGSRRRLVVDGVDIEARGDEDLLDRVLVPKLAALASRPRGDGRRFVFLAAPPGTGKSTLAALVRDRAKHLDFDAVGIDGFHYRQEYLDSHYLDSSTERTPLSAIKGAPETFDVDALSRLLADAREREVTWPVYDRRLHDVAPDGRRLTARLVLVEGNWLLLDEPGWRDLSTYAAFVIFITADPRLLRDRLVDRKIRGGLSPTSAAEFYERSDRLNIERVLNCSDLSKVDLTFHLGADGTIQQGDPS